MKSNDRQKNKKIVNKLNGLLLTVISLNFISVIEAKPGLAAHLYLTDISNIANLELDSLNLDDKNKEKEKEKDIDRDNQKEILIQLKLVEDPKNIQTIIEPDSTGLVDRDKSNFSWVSKNPNHNSSVIGRLFPNQKIGVNLGTPKSSLVPRSIAHSGTPSTSIIKPFHFPSFNNLGNTSPAIVSRLPIQPVASPGRVNTATPPAKLTGTSNTQQYLTKTPSQNTSGGWGNGGFPANTNSSTNNRHNDTSQNDTNSQDKISDAQIVQANEKTTEQQQEEVLINEDTKSLTFLMKSIQLAFNIKFYHLFILLFVVFIDYRQNHS